MIASHWITGSPEPKEFEVGEQISICSTSAAGAVCLTIKEQGNGFYIQIHGTHDMIHGNTAIMPHKHNTFTVKLVK